MTEQLLQFIWQYQYYNTQALVTEQGDELKIVKQGTLNTHQGPDFSNASIQLNGITFHGSIELHINSSHWLQHNHNTDFHYNNVILHVVWQHDVTIEHNQKPIPTLVLQNRVAKVLLSKYESLMKASQLLACANSLPLLSSLSWLSWKERLIVERLQEKSIHILKQLELSNNHWEEVFWWQLAYNFGLKVNAPLFEAMAKTISVNILAKHKNQIHQLEALLLGQANLLNTQLEQQDAYYTLLQKEYAFLKQKYQLQPVHHQPNFLRMRPAAFPTIRLAQLAMLVKESSHLFSIIKDCTTVKQLQKLFNITANDYWHYHYTFKDASSFKEKKLGMVMINNIIINTVIPVLFAYGIYYQSQATKDKCIAWLQQLASEDNTVLRQFTQYSVENKTALDSQALLQLHKSYCKPLHCLRCAVGIKLLRNVT